MWSFGCILYELYVGYPLFAGENEQEQLACIMEIKGVPPMSVLAVSSRRKIFFDENMAPKLAPNSRGKLRKPSTKKLADQMDCEDELFVDFVDKCIEWKTEDRPTPEQALKHQWIRQGLKELTKGKETERDSSQTDGSLPQISTNPSFVNSEKPTHANTTVAAPMPYKLPKID